ncbi:hypothetical protein [Streptococcus equi]|nr:hypothetical protein [Streptococcus equi]
MAKASDNEINRVVAIARENDNDVIIGLGGGKTMTVPRQSLTSWRYQ